MGEGRSAVSQDSVLPPGRSKVYLRPETLPVPLGCRRVLGRAGATTTVWDGPPFIPCACRVSLTISVSCSLCAAARRESNG